MVELLGLWHFDEGDGVLDLLDESARALRVLLSLRGVLFSQGSDFLEGEARWLLVDGGVKPLRHTLLDGVDVAFRSRVHVFLARPFQCRFDVVLDSR